MGNVLTSNTRNLEHDVVEILGYIALDGSSNVIGKAPTATPVGAGPYTRAKGLDNAIGFAGAVAAQPHDSTGEYVFTLDQPWVALIGVEVTPNDSASATLDASCDANVRANTTGPRAGADPGTNTSLTVQTVRIRFRNSAGTLTDPPANGGFWLRLVLKRDAIY